MTTATAWISGEYASPGEIANRDMCPSTIPVEGQIPGTFHTRGENANSVFVVVRVDTDDHPEGDYSDSYRRALEALLAADSRVREGKAYSIKIF